MIRHLTIQILCVQYGIVSPGKQVDAEQNPKQLLALRCPGTTQSCTTTATAGSRTLLRVEPSCPEHTSDPEREISSAEIASS